MSDLKRRTPDEVELYYLGKIASMTVEMMDFQERAVEVLAKIIWETDWGDCRMTEEARAEARELLGIKENNDKEI